MEEIIKKIIDIDKEAVGMEKTSKELIEKKQNNLKKYFEDIENKEQKKAEEKIKKETQEIKERTDQKIKELEMGKENKIKIIQKNYMKEKDEIIKESIKKILQL